jgi:hypothetical protein
MKGDAQIKYMEACVEIWTAINWLRDGPADSVTILCDNEEPPPLNAIECNADWTGFEDMRFEGNSIMECLEKAVAEKRKRIK